MRSCGNVKNFQELGQKKNIWYRKYRLPRSFLSCARGIIETVWKSKEGST